MITNKWIPCSDENYWTNEDGYATIIKWQDSYLTEVYVYDNCPYGWNTLCKNGAKLMNIKL